MRHLRVPSFGPRAKRRLGWVAVTAAGLLVAAGLIYDLTGAGNSSTGASGHPKPSTRQQLGYGELDLGVPYGSTSTQVQQHLGPPTTKHATCWIYAGKHIPNSYRAVFIDATKFCFAAGGAGDKVVAEIFNHSPAHTIVKRDPITHAITSRQRFPATWLPAITLMNPATETTQ